MGGGRKSLSEHSGKCMDMREDNLLISADEHVQTTGPEHGDRHSPRPVKEWRRSSTPGSRVGRAAIRSQHPSSRGRSTEGLCPRPSAASSHPNTDAASGPEPGTWKHPDPRRRSSRGSGAQNRPAYAAIAATQRVRPVPSERFLALWCQAHTPSCSRQVTSTSIRMVKPGQASAPRGRAPL